MGRPRRSAGVSGGPWIRAVRAPELPFEKENARIHRPAHPGSVLGDGFHDRQQTRETDGDPAGINRCAVGLGGGSCVDADERDVLPHFNSASLSSATRAGRRTRWIRNHVNAAIGASDRTVEEGHAPPPFPVRRVGCVERLRSSQDGQSPQTKDA
jgi:hypothetical protein